MIFVYETLFMTIYGHVCWFLKSILTPSHSAFSPPVVTSLSMAFKISSLFRSFRVILLSFPRSRKIGKSRTTINRTRVILTTYTRT